MAKSYTGRGRRTSSAAGSPRFTAPGRPANPGDLIRRAEQAPDLDAFLAKANSKVGPPGVGGFPPYAPTSSQIPSAKVREANLLARDGARQISEKRPAEAIPMLSRSIQLNPGVAGYHHDLGHALLATGQAERAAEAFAAALHLDPGIATAHQFLALIFDNLGQEAKALARYKAAVALKADLVDAHLRIGEICRSRLLHIEAAAAFRAAAAAARGTATALIAEACALEASGAFDEALAAMRAVVEKHPRNGGAHAILGKFLGEAGLWAEATEHNLRVTELLPGLSAAWAGVAINKKFTAEDGPLIARMNAALARPDATPRDRRTILFALGKAHDDIGDYEQAMKNFEAANRLRALSGGLKREALVRHIDRLIEATPPGYRDREPDPGVEDSTPILIVGMPRSGSTLTEQILSSHPEIAAGGEMEFWRLRDTPRLDLWKLASGAEATRGLAKDYLAALAAVGPGARRVTDKALNNFMLLGFIHRVFPNATLIHCRRHPIDTALSIFTTNLEASFDFAANRSDLVFYFRQYQRLMAHWREVLPPDRFVEVDYETLVAEPDQQARRLVAACGLEWSDACLAPQRNARTIQTASLWQARQPIYRTSVERWRRYKPWLGALSELGARA
jgi:tetratricopeptide (TPR) repeat protein